MNRNGRDVRPSKGSFGTRREKPGGPRDAARPHSTDSAERTGWRLRTAGGRQAGCPLVREDPTAMPTSSRKWLHLRRLRCQGQRVRPRGTYSTAAAATLRNQGKKMWALKGTRNTVTKAGQWGHGDLRRQWDAMRRQKCGGPSRWDPRQQRQHRKAVMLAGWAEMTSTSSAAPAGPLSFTTSQHQQLAALVDETAENPARGHPTMGFNPFKWTPEGAGSAFKMLPSTPKWTGPTSSYILIRITFLPLLHCQQLSTCVVPRPVYTSTRGLSMFDSCRPGGNVKCADLPCCCPTVSSQPRGHTRGNLPMK